MAVLTTTLSHPLAEPRDECWELRGVHVALTLWIEDVEGIGQQVRLDLGGVGVGVSGQGSGLRIIAGP